MRGPAIVAASSALAVAGAVAPSLLRSGPVSLPPHGETPSIELVETAYLPDEIVIPAGVPAPLRLRNARSLQHDFSIDALRSSPDVRPGMSLEVDVTAPPGRYEVCCSFPGYRAAGMVAVLVAAP